MWSWLFLILTCAHVRESILSRNEKLMMKSMWHFNRQTNRAKTNNNKKCNRGKVLAGVWFFDTSNILCRWYARKNEYVRSIKEEFRGVLNLGRKRWISLVFCIKYFPVWGIGKWRVHSSASSPKIYSSFIVGGQLWLAPSPIIISWKSFQHSKRFLGKGQSVGWEMPLHWLFIS